MVRAEGLEPPHLSTTGPKPAASTNSATRADAVGGAAYNRHGRLGNPLKPATLSFPRAFVKPRRAQTMQQLPPFPDEPGQPTEPVEPQPSQPGRPSEAPPEEPGRPPNIDVPSPPAPGTQPPATP